MINKNFQKISVFVFAGAVVLFFLFAFVIPPAFANLAVDENESENIVDSTIPDTTTSPITHLKTPKAVKSIYMTQCIAGNKRLRARLVKLAQDTEINAIVINIKDETGKVAIKTDNPLFAKAYATARCRASDMKDFVAFLHRNDIYAIARIAVFQDPDLVKKHPEWAVKRASDGA
ncbi:MAG TPA: hypothetical protein DIC51_02195, partial [Coxiellaceae bacterium]|nr:hypothetical protein [Coxiellaceae bacterium]